MSSEVKEELVGDALFGTPEKKLVCAFCGAEVSGAKKSANNGPDKPNQDDALLDDLFGDTQRADTGLSLSRGEARFCKNCAHYISSPFLSRCHLHQSDVEPMHVCPDFVFTEK